MHECHVNHGPATPVSKSGAAEPAKHPRKGAKASAKAASKAASKASAKAPTKAPAKAPAKPPAETAGPAGDASHPQLEPLELKGNPAEWQQWRKNCMAHLRGHLQLNGDRSWCLLEGMEGEADTADEGGDACDCVSVSTRDRLCVSMRAQRAAVRAGVGWLVQRNQPSFQPHHDQGQERQLRLPKHATRQRVAAQFGVHLQKDTPLTGRTVLECFSNARTATPSLTSRRGNGSSR